MTGPLATLKVVEFTGLGPAPLAGQLLADLGASVTVIDRASGRQDITDINRRGKRSIALDLKNKAGLDAAHQLIAKADILIEGFRPGVMERLGLGPADCPEHVIYGRMTGWGQDGPWAQSAGHDINYLAMTGALHAIGPADRPPVVPLNLIADFGGGSLFLIMGILSAVIERGTSGKGQVVDAAMVDGVPAMMGLIHTLIARQEWAQTRESNWLDGASHFYRCYTCADGKFISVGALEPQFFAELLQKADLPSQNRKTQHDPTTWREAVHDLTALFKTRSRDAWMKVFEGSDACVAPVLDFSEAFLHPVNQARNVFVENEGVWQANAAPRLSRSVAPQAHPPHAPGSDADEILTENGFDADAIDALRKSGALT